MVRPLSSVSALVACVLVLGAPGCASMNNLFGKEPGPFGGVRLTAWNLEHDKGPQWTGNTFTQIGRILDLPFSLVMDVALLPITSVLAFARYRATPKDTHAEPLIARPPTPRKKARPKPVRKPPPKRTYPWEPSQPLGPEPLVARVVGNPACELSVHVVEADGEPILVVKNTGTVAVEKLVALVTVSHESPQELESVTLELMLGRIPAGESVRSSLRTSFPCERVGLMNLADGDAVFGEVR